MLAEDTPAPNGSTTAAVGTRNNIQSSLGYGAGEADFSRIFGHFKTRLRERVNAAVDYRKQPELCDIIDAMQRQNRCKWNNRSPGRKEPVASIGMPKGIMRLIPDVELGARLSAIRRAYFSPRSVVI